MAKITHIEIKKGDKGDYKALTVEGQQYPVNIFKFHSLFNSVEAGDDVELEKNGKWTNVVDPAKVGAPQRKSATDRSVEKAQERKEDSIRVSSTARDATLIANSFPAGDEAQYKTNWLAWRAWLWRHWDDPEDPEWITNNTTPF